MSTRHASEILAAALSVALWVFGLATVVIATAIIWTMDPSSASQGGRYFVAVGALVVLAIIDRQVTALVRRRLPFSLSTHPAERRYHRRSFLAFVATGVFLLGLAHYRATGMSAGLATILLFGALLAATPFLFSFVLHRFVRPVVDRGVGRVADGMDEPSARRTWSFSFGTPPASPPLRRSRRPSAPVMSTDRAAWYRNSWSRIRGEFEKNPVEGVRTAHALIFDLIAETGQSGILMEDVRFEATDPSGIGSVIESALNRVRNARDVQAAVQSALAGEPAHRDELRLAMDEYERILKRLLTDSP